MPWHCQQSTESKCTYAWICGTFLEGLHQIFTAPTTPSLLCVGSVPTGVRVFKEQIHECTQKYLLSWDTIYWFWASVRPLEIWVAYVVQTLKSDYKHHRLAFMTCEKFQKFFIFSNFRKTFSVMSTCIAKSTIQIKLTWCHIKRAAKSMKKKKFLIHALYKDDFCDTGVYCENHCANKIHLISYKQSKSTKNVFITHFTIFQIGLWKVS